MLKDLIPLNLPDVELKMARKEGAVMVWDNIRKKYLKLTPEEWVRQHFVHFLLISGYPLTSIALEGGFRLNKKLQRTDILIYKNSKPALIIECKAPQVNISQNTFDQAARYNLVYNTSFIIVTNGLSHYAAQVDHTIRSYNFLDKIPDFNEL